MQKYQLYIDGTWTDPGSARWLDSVNPYTGEPWAQVPHGNASDVDQAVAAARRAFAGEWSSLRPSQRGRLLLRLADLIEQNAGHLAEIEVRDNGKLYAEMSLQT